MFIRSLLWLFVLSTLVFGDFAKGFKYYNAKNYQSAVNEWIVACTKNDVKACNVLALMYDNGEFVRENKKKAKSYYKKACEGGDKVGCKFYKKLQNLGY